MNLESDKRLNIQLRLDFSTSHRRRRVKPGRRCGKTSNRSRWCMNPNAQTTRVESFDRSALAFFSNRRIRTRTYGGVGGAEPRGSPLSRSLTQLGHWLESLILVVECYSCRPEWGALNEKED